MPDSEPAERPEDFDDALYLLLNRDVAGAVASGVFADGFAHYAAYGAKEGRRYRPDPAEGGGVPSVAVAQAAGMPPFGIEALRVSPCGALFLAGWLDDADDPLAALWIAGEGWSAELAGVSLARQRRRDVEAALPAARRHPYGFWSVLDTARPFPRGAVCRLRLVLRSGAAASLDAAAAPVTAAALRDAALEHLAGGDHFGAPQPAAIASLDGGAGAQLIALNRRLSAAHAADPYLERFGPQLARPHGSIVVCLYGRPDYLFLQNALFAGGAGIGDYEFLYVCNSPELGERLLRDARIASAVHGLAQTLILLPGNAGFGAANNLAARHAASGRVLAVNPDVFPHQPDWARRHSQIVAAQPAARTDLFGAALYYADGSLMHGGMYIEADRVPIARPDGYASRDLLRVEHYGKGAPPDAAQFVRPRAVTAVTGAFLSARRGWFEQLGGFCEDYIFGHYEDADLCLRSLSRGAAPWLHDVKLWHLEGAGGARAQVHEGALLVNRWLFSRRWADAAGQGLLGPSPAHPLLAEAPAKPAAKRGRRG